MKNFKKFDWIAIGILVIYFIFAIFAVLSIENIGKQIDNQGGLGKSIGTFLNDIQTEVDK